MAVVTRYVEIPEAAYEDATDAIAYMLRSWPASASLPHHPDLSPRDVLRAFAITALEAAALPYLAPVGDGGLREALEKLCVDWSERSEGYGEYRELRALLATHPAAPAAPQPVSEATPELTSRPVDREALVTCLVRQAANSPASVVGLRPFFEGLADAVLAVLAGEQERSDG